MIAASVIAFSRTSGLGTRAMTRADELAAQFQQFLAQQDQRGEDPEV